MKDRLGAKLTNVNWPHNLLLDSSGFERNTDGAEIGLRFVRTAETVEHFTRSFRLSLVVFTL